MSEPEKFAEFVHAANFGAVGRTAAQQLKVRVLGAIGAAVAALDAPELGGLRGRLAPAAGNSASLIGGGRAAPTDAAFFNTALAGWLDYTDAYVGTGASCRPSDCIGPLLAAAEDVGANGRDFLAALAVGYQLQVRICDAAAPAGSIATAASVAAAAGRVLGLAPDALARAVAGATAAGVSATLPPDPSDAVDLDFARAAAGGLDAALRASASAGGEPVGANVLAGLNVDWTHERLDAVLSTAVKRHLADIHLQAPIDATLSIRTPPVCDVAAIQSVRVTTWQPAANDADPDEAGAVPYVRTAAQARSSIPYAVAAALIDGQVQAPQYAPDRIARPDVQSLSRKVQVIPLTPADRKHLDEIPTQVAVVLADGTTYCTSARSYHGYSVRQLEWDEAWMRFQRLVEPRFSLRLAARVADCVYHLEDHAVRDLTALFAEFDAPLPAPQG